MGCCDFFSFPCPSRDKVSTPLELCGPSAYCFILIPNLFSFLIASAVIWGQLFVLWLLFNDIDESEVYDSGDSDPDTVTWQGILSALVILALSVAPHFFRGLQLLCTCHGLPTLLAGLANVAVATSCFIVGFNGAFISGDIRSDTRLFTTVVIALFVEQVDEQVYSIMRYLSPAWYIKQTTKLEQKYLAEKQNRGT